MDVAEITTATEIRSRNLHREKALKQYTLCIWGIYILFFCIGLMMIFNPPPKGVDFVDESILWITGIGAVAGMIILWGSRKMKPWSKWPLTIFALIGLLLFPLGTIFGILTIKILYRGPAPRLLTPEYYRIVVQTGHLNERTSPLTWIAMALICVIVIIVYLVAQIPPEIRHLK